LFPKDQKIHMKGKFGSAIYFGGKNYLFTQEIYLPYFLGR
jgi:hypothetical protein